MEGKRMKIGAIGTGKITERIIQSIKKTAHLKCTAVYSRELQHGLEFAARTGVEKVYTDLETFLCDETLDIIYVASPNSLHYVQAKAALEHGKHVICEKPLTLRYEEACDLFASAKEKGLLFFEASTIAHAPNFALVRKYLPRIGRIRLALGSYSQFSSRYELLKKGQVTNVFDPAFGGGALMDINYYNVYEFTALFGRPKQVAYYPNLAENGVDTSGILILVYPDFICECTGAKDTAGVNSVQIQGEDGYIYIEGSTNASGPVQVVTGIGQGSPWDVRAAHDALQPHLYDAQPDGDQWYYEMQSLDRLFFEMNFIKQQELAQVSLHTAWVLDQAREQMMGRNG